MSRKILRKVRHEAKVIAILKPGKSGNNPRNYRPISLLSIVYKLFKRVHLARIQMKIVDTLLKEQADFRHNRNCCELVCKWWHAENGFREKIKSGAVFLDLTCTYNTVWKRGLLLKLTNILNCKMTFQLIESMSKDKKFWVHLKGNVSKYKYLQNGFSQDSVFSPIIFNVYTADISSTTTRKFIYADDVCLVAQAGTF